MEGVSVVGQQKLLNADSANILQLRDVAMATIFRFVYQCAYWYHLANTTELSMCGGDADLCQITL